jgi:hypothetical protein
LGLYVERREFVRKFRNVGLAYKTSLRVLINCTVYLALRKVGRNDRRYVENMSGEAVLPKWEVLTRLSA